MIETTIKCVCDRCKNEVKAGSSFYKLKTISIYGWEDKHVAYHLCEQCRIEMNEWMNLKQ